MGRKGAPGQHHIVPNKEKGGWDIQRAKGERASGHFEKKQEAIEKGREISQRQGTDLIIHGKDGKIQRSDSHGHDPCPPKDKK